MADVMDLPPEPLPRDAAERERSDAKRRGDDDSRQPSRHDKHSKRRKSLSPPLPHRERRHSPPSRRSPATHKRSRRDDDRYDGGRGYGGGGDYGRHRSSADWSGRSMYGGGEAPPRTRDGLLSYKHFIAELEDDILPAEAERRYEEYKAEYVSTQKRAYFEQHKDEDWLREKYDPSRLDSLMARRTESAKSSARDFMLELQAGSLDMGAAAAAAATRPAAAADTEMDDDDKRNGGRQPDAIPRTQFASSELKRVATDVQQAQALVKKLDAEKGLEGNILLSSEQQNLSSETGGPIVIVRGANQVKGLEGLELLDVLLTYLWRVHGVDYYGMVELRDVPRGYRHLRGEDKAGDDGARAEWERKLDSTWQTRLQGQDPVEAMLGKDKSEASMAEALEPYVRKIRDEKYGWKYGCLATGCSKLFHGPEFVHKHLKLKHPEIVNDSMAKVRKELYYQNYMSDPNAPGVLSLQSSQSSQTQRDSRLHRRRPVMLGNRGRSDDVDKSPGGEYAYEGTGPSSSEQPMFDPFTGPNIHGGTFGSEIPPPVLMPVPGAGPLGPFVPAPPDVTMRMWREHGGPQPFHPTPFDPAFDGDRGRKGRGGAFDNTPQMVPPVRHDPRHMRSYHDLDAPEDDVTVIDYRSI